MFNQCPGHRLAKPFIISGVKITISPNSTDKNAEIVRSDVMIGVRTPVHSLYVCEFMMALSSRLFIKKIKIKITLSIKNIL